MTQKEFEDRTGIKVSASDYSNIETMYMMAGNMDKDVFCKEYKNHKDSLLLQELFKKIKTIRGQYEERINEIEDLHKQKDQMADFLITQAEKWSASDLREKAIEMLGMKEYIRRKVCRGHNLWYDDREALNEILKQ